MNVLEELLKRDEMVALGPRADIELLDIVEVTRKLRSGKTRRSYYRVWEMPYGDKLANTPRRILFSGWWVTAANPFVFSNAGIEEFIFPRCEADGSFRGRLESGVTNIYRPTEEVK